ncbi:DUF1917 domain-containing protein [Candidatus Kaiserbacteria bacterium]|nr:DUF1917 domain-containing protein [Candidatus Kaiserbacteria bacterium]
MVNDSWIYARRKTGTYPEHTSRGGKWLVFASGRSMPAIWKRVKAAVENGQLGELAKRNASSGHGVICVYTYDWKDHDDVMRIRSELRTIGIAKKIPYKTDENTERGIYRAGGSKRISAYCE